ncbi:uncharacterized protein [Salminus brasiliensis]|uniref:uncharacterized protein isoform X3 n=1 Tax=Salminus brasiliensis TaxID=930266 RepID=UPI003B83988F
MFACLFQLMLFSIPPLLLFHSPPLCVCVPCTHSTLLTEHTQFTLLCGVIMELSRKEVPLYGHARVYFLLHSVAHCEEVFVVLEGSTLRHVLQTKLQRMLYFITPGHNMSETVCVRAYSRVDGELRCVGVAFLMFVEDDAQELAEYLVTHSNRLSTTESSNLIGRYSLCDRRKRAQMDRRVTLALINTHTPHSLLGQPGQESLLHLCVRVGFVCVCEFLLCQPGALMMINSANQNRDTPLQLAQRTNQHEMINLLSHPPNPLTTPLGGVSQVWTGHSGLLRFSHVFGVMSLSVCVSECVSSPQHLLSAVLLLIECVSDSALTRSITQLCSGSKAVGDCVSDETQSRESSYAAVPYSEWLISSSDDDGGCEDDGEDEELLLSVHSGGSEHQRNSAGSPAGFSESSDTSNRSIYDEEKEEEEEEEEEKEEELPSEHGSSPSRPWDKPTHSTTDPEELKMVTESKKNDNEEPTAEEQRTENRTSRTKLCPQVCETDGPQQIPDSCVGMLCADSVSGSWKNPQQLKVFNNCPLLLCSSSHSSHALFVSSFSNAQAHRRRSNSEGYGHEVTVRKSWSVIGESTSCSLIPSSAPAPLDYSAESWSASVDPEFLNTLDRGAVKRQEVIYELMQTEFHHVQTLTVMADVLRRGLQEEVQLDEDVIGQIFPSLDDLITLHSTFLTAMETRRRGSSTAGNHRNYKHHKNYIIQRIGDVLLQQFGDAVGEQVMDLYGDFCSKHSDALRVYKHLQQNNRKLQMFIRQQSSNSLIKRREIPEFLLLVTQRITKYPVLLERLLQHTDGDSVERGEVAAALEGLRGVLVGVERRVSEVQRAKKLDEIINRLDPKSCTRLKSGEIYTKHTLTHTSHTLTHSAMLTCRTTSGRLRDVLALLLTDVLVFLQEKEQRLTFAALEQKPAVVILKGLIWREIANQERGLFLISSDASVGPEMYEIHTHTREERNTWITLLQHSTDSLPDAAECGLRNNEEQKIKKIQKLQEAVFSLDLQVCAALEEKLCVCAAGELSLTPPHLLLQPHHHTLHSLLNTPQGLTLLQDAQRHDLMITFILNVCWPVEEPSMLSVNWKCPVNWTEGVLGSTRNAVQIHRQVVESIQSLSQILYSLQAVVIIQDSLFEVQKLLLLEDEAPPTWPLTDCGDLKVQKTSAEWLRLEEREREQAEEMEGLQREWVELEVELHEFEGCVQTLREEQRRVEEERERLERTLVNNNNNNNNNNNTCYSLSVVTPPTTD